MIASVTRLSHILAVFDEFSLFIDRKNILKMMSPHRFGTNGARNVVHKAQRWVVCLCEFNYTIEHIPGESNTWADMLTRWASFPFESFPARRLSSLRVLLIKEEHPELPSIAAMAESQVKQLPGQQSEYRIDKIDDHYVWVNEAGQLHIPPGDTSMQLRICMATYCGRGGHRGATAATQLVAENVTSPTMEADIDSFVENCLFCHLSSAGQKVPWPLEHQAHAGKVGELLHFDFLCIGKSDSGHKYILIMKDDLCGYNFLHYCVRAEAEFTVEVLEEHFRRSSQF